MDFAVDFIDEDFIIVFIFIPLAMGMGLGLAAAAAIDGAAISAASAKPAIERLNIWTTSA